jgi:hypothetical protein
MQRRYSAKGFAATGDQQGILKAKPAAVRAAERAEAGTPAESAVLDDIRSRAQGKPPLGRARFVSAKSFGVVPVFLLSG